ncbi:MAG: hypothetical protein VB934_12655 [Polyangiaceae bacterium]
MKFDVDPSVRDEACSLAETKSKTPLRLGSSVVPGVMGSLGMIAAGILRRI